MQLKITPKNKEYFKLIKEALDQRRLAFFVGAGVSNASNPQYPSWAKITETLKKELNGCKETDPLKIAQHYAIKYSKPKLKEAVISCFPENEKTSDIQESILDLKPHYIISTNWDCLFENFLSERISYIYDVIASDNELVKSKNECKIIKMHGDFSHNNYVFTEDDYLNYSRSFPLIENYVKSIISTHTIVMMGYSFSDIDLKKIVNWLQNNSKVQPPIYMLTHQKDEYLENYLKKYGIKTIAINSENKSQVLRDFLQTLLCMNDYSQDPVKFVYNKIKRYEEYETVLQDNIQNSLGLCDIRYNSHKKGILHFQDFDSIIEEDNIQRNIYKRFIKSIDTSNETIKKIINILSKANITGIITSKNKDGTYRYKSFEDYCQYNESPLLNFDFSFHKSSDITHNFLEKILCLAEQDRTYEAFETNKELISHCEKTHNYAYLFIGFFNHNKLLYRLQLLSKKTRELAKQEKKHPLDDLYTSLPQKIQQDYREIYRFLTLQDLYKRHFNVSNDIKMKEKNVRIIEKGGEVFSSDEGKSQSTLRNLIEYVLDNGICIEHHTLFREICQKYVKISFLQQHKQKNFSLDKFELYACVKYFTTEELTFLFDDLKKATRKKSFQLASEQQDWLVKKALNNCVHHFIQEESCAIYAYFDHYIENILFLLAHNKLSEELLNIIWNYLNKLVDEAHNTLAIFSAINTFVDIQWNLYRKTFNAKQIIALLENLLRKFAYKKTNGYEETAMSWNSLYNLYACGRNVQSKFTSEEIILQVMQKIDKFSQNKKIRFIQNVLLELYQISDKKCKRTIQQYALKQKLNTSDNFESLLEFLNYRLHLAALSIEKNSHDICKMVEKTLQEYPDKVYYFSIRTTANLLDLLKKFDSNYASANQKVQRKVNELNKKFGHT